MDVIIRSGIVAAIWAAGLNLLPVRADVAAQPNAPAGIVELRPGVVVDLQRQVVYVMNPKGGVDALGLARGQVMWHSDQAARPLAANATVLVAQAELPRPGNELRVSMLDARTGRLRRSVAHSLPANARALVVGTAEGTFSVQARATSADATLAWEFVDVPLQGVKPGALDLDRPASDSPAAPTAAPPPPSTTGVVRIDLARGTAADVPSSGNVALASRTADVAADARVPSVTGEQFLSSDGRHVIGSERVADDSVWEKYQWTVFERATGRRIGSLRDYRSHAPFIVVGSSIVYEIGPFDRRTDAGLVSEPLRIRSVDLVGGAQLWIRPVRDTTYRGPLPG